MASETSPRRQTAACPWCSDGTLLQLKGDGIGGMSLWCTQCGCKGPTVPISDDFEAADEAAISRWSTRQVGEVAAPRPRIAEDTIGRVRRTIELQVLLNGGPLPDDAGIPIRAGDIRQLMRAAGAFGS